MMENRTRRDWLVFGAAALAVSLYIGWSLATSGLGFPLDDGWIHQTYARNLARAGRWEYTPGVVSAGSTAPLWTLLLAVGYVLRIPFLLWTFLLGSLSLLWMGGAGMALWRQLWPEWRERAWVAGLLLVLSWPLVWGALSGMETIFFIALGLTLIWAYGRVVMAAAPGWHAVVGLGLLSGLLILTRPDGLVLVLLVGLGLLLYPGSLSRRARLLILWGLALVLPLIPYFAFNWQTSGSIWPNTFYAKQTEYQAVLERPLPLRTIQLLYFSLGGPEVGWRGISGARWLLWPGLFLATWYSLNADWKMARLWRLLPLLWAGGHVFLYAWRLPVTYQHGRYLMAALPVWILYGLAGWLWIWMRAGSRRPARIGRQVGVLTLALLLIFFLMLGAGVYASDVAFIEGEMVTVANWLASNTPPDALVAAHDIGAIGYFAERPILDLAGLITPEVIPLLDDPQALAGYVLRSPASYLVTAPGWPYTAVTSLPETELLFDTDYAWTRERGWNNMVVYRLP